MNETTGQCHCGTIQYAALNPRLNVEHCDCVGCQRASGTLRVPFIHVGRADLNIAEGRPTDFRAKSGEKCDAGGVWQFCSDCGTQLFWDGDRGDEIAIFAGTVDDPSLLQSKE